jgi:hypothetical protein
LAGPLRGSENRRFLQVGNHLLPEPLRDGWAALTRAEGRLNVDVVAAAHGCEHVSAGTDPAPFLELAEYLRTHPQEESACHALFSPITTRGKPADLLATIGQPLPPLPSIIGELAVAAGLLQRSGDRVHLACPSRDTLERACRERISPEDLFAATRSVQFAQAFLSGGWWEVCVWHAARQSGAFRDLRWSVRFGSETDHLEEDLVGVAGLNLALFSCKRGGAATASTAPSRSSWRPRNGSAALSPQNISAWPSRSPNDTTPPSALKPHAPAPA